MELHTGMLSPRNVNVGQEEGEHGQREGGRWREGCMEAAGSWGAGRFKLKPRALRGPGEPGVVEMGGRVTAGPGLSRAGAGGAPRRTPRATEEQHRGRRHGSGP